MIWLEFIVGGLYTLSIFVGGYLSAAYVHKAEWLKKPTKPRLDVRHMTLENSLSPKNTESSALKSMSPKERNSEQTKEMRDRIEYLLE